MDFVTMTVEEFNKKFNTRISFDEDSEGYGEFYENVCKEVIDEYMGMATISADEKDILEDYEEIFKGRYRNIDLIDLEGVYIAIEY